MTLTLYVTKVTWCPATSPGVDPGSAYATESTAMVEVTGRVAEENMYVKLGAFHTLAIEPTKDVRIEKGEGCWDSISLARINESCAPGRGAEVAAIVCGEGGVFLVCALAWLIQSPALGTAIFCLLSEHMTVVLQRLEVPIPRKLSSQSAAHEKVCQSRSFTARLSR